MPNMLIYSQRSHALEAGLIIGGGLQHWLDRPPQRLPARAELTRETLDGGLFVT